MTAVERNTRPSAAREQHPYRIAGWFTLPFVLLALAWVFSNPAGAAPDESDHLVKALGNASLDLGEETIPIHTGTPVEIRYSEISRTFAIPASLDPRGLSCFAFQPNVTAACQPDLPPPSTGTILATTPLGNYPPTLYIPIGLAAHAASTPYESFVAARLVVLVISALALLLGVAHLVRWLGRRAVTGVVAAMTPVAVFVTGSVSTSGIEITAAIAAACVVAVSIVRPESVHVASTHWTLAAVGTLLVVSRQLGILTLGLLVLVMLANLGWTGIKRLFVERRMSLSVTVAGLFAATAVAAWYELTFDKLPDSGPVLSGPAFWSFLDREHQLLWSSVGVFGWLDTQLPPPMIEIWLAMSALLVGVALMFGRRREVVTLLTAAVVTWLIAYGVDATAFFPVGASLQGRHVLPIAAFVAVLAGAVVAERLSGRGQRSFRRLSISIGAIAGTAQAFSLYWNGRRYAVGMDGPLWFVPHSEWSPPLGWYPWLLLALIGGALLTWTMIRFQRLEATPAPDTRAYAS